MPLLDDSIWHQSSSAKLVVRSTRTSQLTSSRLVDLLAQVVDIPNIDGPFQERYPQTFENPVAELWTTASPIIYKTDTTHLPIQEKGEADSDRAVLYRSLCVVDFYYLYNVLRSVWESNEDRTALLEKDDKELQNLVDFLVRQITA